MGKYSEKELIKLSSEQICLLSKEISKELKVVEEFTNFFPCLIHLNSLSDVAITYLNKYGLEKFQISLEEILKMGVDFVVNIVHPESTNVVVPKLLNFIKEKGDHTLFFEQKIRYSKLNEYENHLSFSKFSNELNSLITLSFPAVLLEEFIRKRIFRESKVYDIYAEKFFTLSPREKEILKYVVLGMTNKEISYKLYISSLTVKTHRQNIFKKLQTNNITELTRIASYFDLIKQD